MSWGQIKKAINTDLAEPLNYLAWINDLATFGEDGYVYNSESIINELGGKSKNALKNTISTTIITNRVLQYNSNVGEFFANLLNDTTGIFSGLSTIEDIIEDETAMTVISNSETAMTAIANSETAMTAVINSETAMTAVANSATAMTVFFGTNSTPNYVVREKIWDSVTASTTVMGSTTGRAWLIANVQKTVEETSSTSYVLKVNKKCLVLALEKYGVYEGNPVGYNAIQPGNLDSADLTTTGTRVENTRVLPLSLKAANPGPTYGNARVYYVQMQE